MENKLQITRKQGADFKINSCGKHTIGFNSLDKFSIDVWFGNSFILKTPEEAMVVCRKISAIDDMLYALQEALPILERDEYAGNEIDLVQEAINKALNG